MDDEKLIDLLKANDVLYNKMHPLSSAEYKRKVWDEVAAEMGFPAERVIARYRTLRDRFVRYKRSLLTRGPENNYDPVIMEKMEFITPYIFIRTKSGKITWEGSEPNVCPSSDPLQISSTSMMLDDTIDTMPLPSSPKLPRRNARRPPKRKVELFTDSNDSTTSHNSVNIKAESSIIHSANRTDSDDDFCEAVNSFKKLCNSRQKRKENEALDGFGQMIMSTISKMNPNKQTKAMLLVTEAVMQIKMEDDY